MASPPPPPPPPPPAPAPEPVPAGREDTLAVARPDSIFAAAARARADAIARAERERASAAARREWELHHGAYGSGGGRAPASAEPSLPADELALDTAQIRVSGLDSLRESLSSVVVVALTRFKVLAARPAPVPTGPSPGVFIGETRVSDSVTVCLLGDSTTFRIRFGGARASQAAKDACASNPVSTTEATKWSFDVTPLKAGPQQLHVQVTAYLKNYGPSTRYDSTYHVTVLVGHVLSPYEKVIKWLTDTTTLVKTVTTLLLALSACWTTLFFWRRKKPSRDAGDDDAGDDDPADDDVKAGVGAPGVALPERDRSEVKRSE
jgi:hypothetical protein